MKESYSEDINMLCFVQGFGNNELEFGKRQSVPADHNDAEPNTSKTTRKEFVKQISLDNRTDSNRQSLVLRKSLRLSPSEKIFKRLPDRRSLSDRFSLVTDNQALKSARSILTIRKTWSTGNFSAGAGGGGCGAPRSAPATPLQLEPHPRSKHDKHAVKPLSGSAPSVRVAALGTDSSSGKQPYKARQKKFQRHFPQVGPEERVLDYYSCALVGDLLLQGHLYITKNYFAFYSNVFGYVTKLLIPTTSVIRITKEKVARIIPNAVGVCTRDERHVFGSLLSRDAAYKLMLHVWKAARVPELVPEPQELRVSEVDLDASEYSPEDDSSSGGADHVDAPHARPDTDAITTTGAAVLQPLLLAGRGATRARSSGAHTLLLAAAALLALSAAVLAVALHVTTHAQEDIELHKLSGEQLYTALVRRRARLHGRAASDLHAFLTTNLLLLTKVRQSLEALSGVILTDMAQGVNIKVDVPNDTVFS